VPPVRISIVIATLGRPDPLRRALLSVRASEEPAHEVLIVDGSTTEEAALVASEVTAGPGVAVRHMRAPRGLTRQRNAGLDAASGDVVLFLDDDARLAPDALGHVARAYRDATVVGVTGKVVEPASNRVGGKTSAARRALPGGGAQGSFTRYGYPRRLLDEDADRDVEFMAGCFMSARLGLARSVRFDEGLPGYALAEDEDFAFRLSRHGRIRYLGAAVVHHDNTGFHGRNRREFGHQVVRNRRYLFRKNFPHTPMARAQFGLLLAVLVVHRIANRDFAGARGLVEAAARGEVLRPETAR
jgi:glycosyltransferase involved in cell wall biosynthesis